MSHSREEQRFALIPTVYLLLRHKNKVLLLRRANTGYMDGRYCLIAGHLEAGESAKIGMVRETREEIGITITPNDLRLIHTGHRYNRSRIDLIFEADTWQGEIANVEPNKCDELSWYPVEHLPDKTIPYVRSLLDAIAKGDIYSEYFEEL